MNTSIENTWLDANEQYLQLRLKRLRCLIHQHALWMQSRWSSDPGQASENRVITDREVALLVEPAAPGSRAEFFRTNEKCSQINEARRDIEQQISDMSEIFQRLGRPPALEILSQVVDLNEFETECVLLCVAPDLDSGFSRLFAYLQDNSALSYPTVQLAETLFFSGSRLEFSRGIFQSTSALRRWKIIEITDTNASRTLWSQCPIIVDCRVSNFLCGINRLDNRLETYFHAFTTPPIAATHEPIVENLIHRISDSGSSVINLTGKEDSGKSAIAGEIAKKLNLELVCINLDRLTDDLAELFDIFQLLQREVLLLQFAVYVEFTQEDENHADIRRVIQEMANHLDALIVINSAHGISTKVPSIVVDIPPIQEDDREAIWHQALAGTGYSANGELALLAQQFEYGPEAIMSIVQTACDQAELRDPHGQLASSDLWDACQQSGLNSFPQLIQPATPMQTWDDLVVSEEIRSQLRDLADQVFYRRRVYEEWGLGKHLGRGLGITALFAGPSGTGKTMAAEILAGHLHRTLQRIDLAGIVSKYIGETEKNLHKVFHSSEQSNAILFFDEADALFGKRTDVKDSHDRYANIEVNYLLQRMENYRGLAILATNRKQDLDTAFTRRLRFILSFEVPDFEQRRLLWQKAFPETVPIQSLNFDALARLEIPGGSIRSISLNAAFKAASDDDAIRMDHVMEAAYREYAKSGRLISETEFGNWCPTARRPRRKRHAGEARV